MSTFTDKELIKEIKERISSLDVRDNVERRAYEIALASLEAEPIAWECGENTILFNPDTVEAYAKRAEITPKPLFAAPPAPVVPDKLPREYINGLPLAYSDYAEGLNDCREAMLQDKRESGKQVCELTMLVKRLASSLKSVNKSSNLPDKAMEYLKQNGLVGVEDILR
ncbi:hypothetical protein AOY87_14160 [Escherichia coli]|nr:hypothetical protein AOY87_14160 [Escherichia coli]